MKRTALLLIPAAIFAFLAWQLDLQAIGARLARANPWWLLAAVLAAQAQTVLCGLRWKMTARALGPEIGARRAVSEYFVTALLNNTLPSGVVGDAARAMRARELAGLKLASLSVVIERLAGQMSLWLVMLVSILLTLWLPSRVRWPGEFVQELPIWLSGGAAALLVAAIALQVIRPDFARALALPVHRALFARGLWFPQGVLGLSIVACNLATFAFAARATGTEMPVEAVLTLVPLILTAMMIPASVSGWGFREGAAAAVLPLAGIRPEAAVAASLAFGAVLLIASLPGAFWVSRPPGPPPDPA